ncbi:MAG: MgtC/SapB family protein [Dehalobacterium sp.]
MNLSQTEIVLRLFVGLVVGLILGLERTRRHKAAGIRTHALVCISATSISIVSAYGFAEFQGNNNMDPARLIVGIITGIGFLGAGIIWKEPSGVVQGLTTAANIWAVAGLGIAVGLGHFFLVFATVFFMICALQISRLLVRLGITGKDQKHPVPVESSDDD